MSFRKPLPFINWNENMNTLFKSTAGYSKKLKNEIIAKVGKDRKELAEIEKQGIEDNRKILEMVKANIKNL